jgi:protein-tyrosine phosphatase
MSDYRICFVCLGNICRSPTAEAVMRGRLREAGLEEVVLVESAGTGDWHVGDPPDRRAHAEGTRRGVPLGGRSAQFQEHDFARFDLVLALDRKNAADLRILAPDDAAADKVRLLREYDATAEDHDVPDPYYGGPDGFADTFDIIERAIEGLLAEIVATGRAGRPPA